jgi:DNA ligase-1
MRFSDLCAAYVAISNTPKRLAKTSLLADLLRDVPEQDMENVMMLLKGRVFPEWDKTTIGISHKLAIKAIQVATGATEAEIVRQFKKMGDLGDVAAHLVKDKRQSTLARSHLVVDDIVKKLRKLAQLQGHGSVDQKLKLVAQLLSNATPDEAMFLVRILLEDLRIGIAEGTIRDAILWWSVQEHERMRYDPEKNAWEGGEDAAAKFKEWQQAIQDAVDRSNDVARVALTARKSGIRGLRAIELTLGTPTKVMLAQRSVSIPDAFERVGKPAAVEYKYDGFRMQIHKGKEKTVLFTRRLEDVTAQFPDVIAALKGVKDECLLDAEIGGYDPQTKRHSPFQHISQRIRRKYDIDRLAKEFPVEVNVFDILMHKGKAVYPLPFRERRALLEKVVPNVPFVIKPSDLLITDDEKKAEQFYKDALAHGYEGLMLKSLDAPYKPGSRVGFMVKLKPTLDTLDLVVVGAEWGEGKRSGWLTSFTIACQNEDGNLVELGRVGTGFKELESEEGVSFAQMTELLKDDILEEHGKEIKVRPKVVIEVRYEEIQKSPSYSSGFALRFPRIVKVRPDRRKDEVSTLADVLDLYEAQRGRGK